MESGVTQRLTIQVERLTEVYGMANYHFKEAGLSAKAWTRSGSTLTQQVYETLHEEIISGTLRPGDRLVRRTLSKRLGVSPMPVTEALFKLEMDGLVESLPLHGSRVRPLTIQGIRNDQVLREAIECQVARICAENATDAQLSKLIQKARVLDRIMFQGDPRSKLGMQTHLKFHLEVARCAGFVSLGEELQRVWFRRLMRLSWIKATKCTPVPEDWHQQVVRAITSRDPDRADAKMREHVRYGTGSDDEQRALQYSQDSLEHGSVSNGD